MPASFTSLSEKHLDENCPVSHSPPKKTAEPLWGPIPARNPHRRPRSSSRAADTSSFKHRRVAHACSSTPSIWASGPRCCSFPSAPEGVCSTTYAWQQSRSMWRSTFLRRHPFGVNLTEVDHGADRNAMDVSSFFAPLQDSLAVFIEPSGFPFAIFPFQGATLGWIGSVTSFSR